MELMTASSQFSAPAADKEAIRWQQVLARDPVANGAFVYAVASTGIYCRATCASRRPQRRHVRFFPTTAAARAAGFRACKRCKPDEVAPTHQHSRAIAQVCAFLKKNPDRAVTLEELGRLTGMSPFTLQRSFKSVLGVSPRQYAAACRLENLRDGLKKPGARVTDAIYDAGFNSSSRAYARTTEALGMRPKEFRGGGESQQIRYAIVETHGLGKLLVAATEKGVCAIAFDDSAAVLEKNLRGQFPKATLHVAQYKKDAALANAVSVILSQLTEHPASLNLPLDVRATAFQQRVWQALRRIPRGETRSYAQVAAALGSPKSVRAVARAIASNPVAIALPCHRVIGSNGSLTGYRWGVERKEKLLALEKNI